MDSEKLSALLKMITTARPSAYEDKYVRWASIGYDHETLTEFLRVLQWEIETAAETGETTTPRLEDLLAIAEELDFDLASRMLAHDPDTMRMCLIERLAREAAMGLLIDGKYEQHTLNTITNLPIADYKLVLRRTHELVSSIQDMNAHVNTIIAGVPGI